MKYVFAFFILIGSGVQAKDKISEKEQKIAELNTAKSKELTIKVKGMVCAFCAQGIEKKFMSQKEIEKVEVSLENKFVKLKFKEGQRLSNDKIAAILKEAGYEANFE